MQITRIIILLLAIACFQFFTGCTRPPSDVISSVYILKPGDKVKLNVDQKWAGESIYRYYNESPFGQYTFQRTLDTKISYRDRMLIASPGDWGTVIEIDGNTAKVEFNNYYLHFRNSDDGAICLETQEGIREGYLIEGGGWFVHWYITTGTAVQTSQNGISWEWQSVIYGTILVALLYSMTGN